MRFNLSITPLILLAACANTSEQTSSTVNAATVSAAASIPCTRGSINATRSFLICDAINVPDDVYAAALAGPADISLDFATVARDFGILPQSITGIEPATYAQIVSTTPEIPSDNAQTQRTSRDSAAQIKINDKNYRKIILKEDERRSSLLIQR